jgi:hypothetical protein
MEELFKNCNSCGERKNLAEFPVHKGYKDGHRGECKVCYNIKQRDLRKKDIVDNKVVKEESEFDKLQKDLKNICLSLNKAEIGKDLVENIGNRILTVNKNALNPPTNSFLICEKSLKNCGSTEVNISKVRSELDLFLVNKKELMHITYPIALSNSYEMDCSLRITLPDDVKLTCEEIDEFRRSLISGPPQKVVWSTELCIEDIDVDQFGKEYQSLVCKFLSKFGLITSISSVYIQYPKYDRVKLLWPKKFAISEQNVIELKKYILEYIIGRL